MNTNNICATCRHFDGERMPGRVCGWWEFGTCHRYAPRYTYRGDNDGNFPRVAACDFCGEHEPMTKPET